MHRICKWPSSENKYSLRWYCIEWVHCILKLISELLSNDCFLCLQMWMCWRISSTLLHWINWMNGFIDSILIHDPCQRDPLYSPRGSSLNQMLGRESFVCALLESLPQKCEANCTIASAERRKKSELEVQLRLPGFPSLSTSRMTVRVACQINLRQPKLPR